MVGDFHDGAAGIMVVKDGIKWQFYATYDSLPMDIIQPMGDTAVRIGKDAFVRMEHPDTTKSDWGILEETLFAGKYRDAQGGEVVFSADGAVSGLDSFAYYTPQIDYTEIMHPVDHVVLRWEHGSPIDLGFRLMGDSLILYRIDCARYNSGTCLDEKLGERIFSMVRLK